MKFLGHLDMIRFFERSFRRLNVPLKFSEGFNPHPKLAFGGPLSVGVASDYEVMEVELSSPINVDQMIAAFNGSAPEGMRLVDYKIITESRSLMSGLDMMVYRIDLKKQGDLKTYDLASRYQAAEAIILRKKNKKKRWVDKDLLPFIMDLVKVSEDEVRETYQLTIKNTPEGAAKPQDIVNLLIDDVEGFTVDDVDITRTGLFTETDDGFKPLLYLS